MSATEPEDASIPGEFLRRDGVAQVARKYNRPLKPAECGPDGKEPSEGVASSGLRKDTMIRGTRTETEPKTTLTKDGLFLQDADVARWHNSLKRASGATASARLRHLRKLCEELNLSAANLASKEPAVITDILDDWVTLAQARGKSGGAIKAIMVSTKSWLAHQGVTLTRKIRLPDDSPVTLRDEQVPEAPELAQALSLGTLKQRVLKELICKSGIRPGVIGDLDGRNGLVLRNLPEISLSPSGASFTRYPPQVVVPRLVSKSGKAYFTFLTRQASTVLLSYLNSRAKAGEQLNLDLPLVKPDQSDRPFLTSSRVSEEIRRSLRPRFLWRPYLFRCTFDTRLLVCEAKGLIPRDVRVFLMGHTGTLEATYTINKERLPESLLTEIRDAYLRCEPYLDGTGEDPNEIQRRKVQAAVTRLAPNELGRALELIRSISGDAPA